mmetsp:Transcript_10369/g.31713  ORF Transcript_10369/g.31713 Transcript_10369/m.31713 type:complete len:533 (+) Transcript_10369:161-1759(+)|eukprot:CAMPEP_0198737118 /NCGR_PEP_ID=MMETSP1475-20131203/67705_1 /TAXON_ID= ORGANISM="Unidentified sp., Strain CCMP1999" /NCGR_SAMPLE_ID=MMETSP1475 /ASSEMBLY_ACC=CAM_ASM_001111 /LENGTH=532 /DNA_ID=CAMNT_0044500975 /DNA_START=511 /DNA_END=2109 /DNA_ORIENTATION=+
MESVSKRLRFDEDEEEEDWKGEEVEIFFNGLMQHGQDWRKITAALGRQGFRRGEAEVIALFEQHSGYLSTPDASAVGLQAIVADYQRLMKMATQGSTRQQKKNYADSGAFEQRAADPEGNITQKNVTSQSVQRRPRKQNICKHRRYNVMVSKLTDTGKNIRKWLINEKAVRWGLAEWFYSHLESDFLLSNDFGDILSTEMRIPPGARLTLNEWGRVRAAMCSMYPNGAKPRRLSQKFLAEERGRMQRHVEKTRAVGSVRLAARECVLAKYPWDGLPRRAVVANSAVTPKKVRVIFTSSSTTLVDDTDVALLYTQPELMLQQIAPVFSAPMTPTTAGPGNSNVWEASGGSYSFMVSPPRAVDASSAGVSVEIDLWQLSEVLDLLDSKRQMLADLWKLNEESTCLTDEHLKRSAALTELNARLNPLAETLSRPLNNAEGNVVNSKKNSISALATAVTREAAKDVEDPVITSAVAKCVGLLMYAAATVSSWQAPQDLRSIIESLQFCLKKDDPAYASLMNAADAFTDAANACGFS